MREIVDTTDWTCVPRNPLIRFLREYFWEEAALMINRCTGLTPGVHRNYRLIK